MDQKSISIFSVIALSFVSFLLILNIEDDILKALVSPLALSIFAAVSYKSNNTSSQKHQIREHKSTSENKKHNEDESIATLYVGNIPYKASEKQITEYFENIATVYSIRLMKDKRTGKRKGFGFIEVPPTRADEIISKMHESVFMDRNLIVRPAKDKVA